VIPVKLGLNTPIVTQTPAPYQTFRRAIHAIAARSSDAMCGYWRPRLARPWPPAVCE
jgi:hypothetical protein